MIKKNYKKIAVIEGSYEIDLRSAGDVGDDFEFTIPINLNFKPSRILLHTKNSKNEGTGESRISEFADTKYPSSKYDNKYRIRYSDGTQHFRAYVKRFDKNNIHFGIVNCWPRLFKNVEIEIIAIE